MTLCDRVILLTGLLMLGLLAMIPIVGFICERRWWNGGKCPNDGIPWRYFDTDSQGGRGYTCDSCDKTILVSYPLIDNHPNGGKGCCK